MRWYAVGCAAAVALGSASLVSPGRAAPGVDHTVGQPDSAQNVTLVIANGLGTTIESAVQNAAENALTQVVGSFVDAETQIERRSQITDGIRGEARNISSKMREYSQGSIKSFEVLDTQQDGGIVRVTAKVAVQADVLHAQLKGALPGATTVGKGLFAQAATEHTQETNADAIFIDRIVLPIVQGAGTRLTIGEMVKVDMNDPPCSTQGAVGNTPICSGTFSLWLSRNRENNVYRIPVTFTVDPSLDPAMWQVATSINGKPCLRLDLNSQRPFDPIVSALQPLLRGQEEKQRYVAVVHRVGESSVGSACYQALNDVKGFDSAISTFTRIAFEVSVLSKEGVVVEQYLYRPYQSYMDARFNGPSSAGSPDFKSSFSHQDMLGYNAGYYVFTPPKTQTFSLLIHAPLTIIEKADRVEVKVVTE